MVKYEFLSGGGPEFAAFGEDLKGPHGMIGKDRRASTLVPPSFQPLPRKEGAALFKKSPICPHADGHFHAHTRKSSSAQPRELGTPPQSSQTCSRGRETTKNLRGPWARGCKDPPISL